MATAMGSSRTQDQRTSKRVLRQHYSSRQRLRAYLYGRFPLLVESLVSLGLVGLVLLIDVAALLAAHPSSEVKYSALDALVDALKLLTFQSSVDPQRGVGPLLYAANVLFALFFIQTLILSARAFFNKLDPQVRQRGLAAACSNHVIVGGIGRLGLRVVTRLVEAGDTVVVIERNWSSEFLHRMLEMRVPVIAGDAKDPSVLHTAGITRACAVVAGIDDDLQNVEIALAARALRSDIRVVLRAFSETFDQALERHFGDGTAFSVSALAAPTFAAAMITRGADHVLPLGTDLLGVGELTIGHAPKGQRAQTLADFERLNAIRVIAHTDAASKTQGILPTRLLHQSDRVTYLAALDRVEALHSVEVGSTLSAANSTALLNHSTETYDTFIVCGHGKVGYRVVRWLLTQQPRPKIVVVHGGQDDTMRGAELRELVRNGIVEEVVGDATAPDVLRQAHIDRAFVVASVTSDDLVNVQVGMEARRQRPDVHVVLRVFSDSLADNLPTLFGIHTAFSTSNLASSTLAAAAEVEGVKHAFAVDGRLFAMDEIVLRDRDRLAGSSVASVRKQYGAVTVSVKRSGMVKLLPADDTVLAKGDVIMVVAELPTLVSMRKR